MKRDSNRLDDKLNMLLIAVALVCAMSTAITVFWGESFGFDGAQAAALAYAPSAPVGLVVAGAH